jgi:hypothetical protein
LKKYSEDETSVLVCFCQYLIPMLMQSLFALRIEINTVSRANIRDFTISYCKGQVNSMRISTLIMKRNAFFTIYRCTLLSVPHLRHKKVHKTYCFKLLMASTNFKVYWNKLTVFTFSYNLYCRFNQDDDEYALNCLFEVSSVDFLKCVPTYVILYLLYSDGYCFDLNNNINGLKKCKRKKLAAVN